MSKALSISNVGLAARAPETAIKKAAKKAAKKAKKKATGHHPPKKQVGSGHEHHGNHDAQDDIRRTYLHLARASSILKLIPKSSALRELTNLYAHCKEFAESKGLSATVAAESARALEHLCFVSLRASDSASETILPQALQRDFYSHFQHDSEKQTKHLAEAEQTIVERAANGHSPAKALFELARHALVSAEQMLYREDWYLAHECLRATDALTKAIARL
jgi:hypothetical protein